MNPLSRPPAVDRLLVATDEALIPEYGGTVAASAFVARALDLDWATQVF